MFVLLENRGDAVSAADAAIDGTPQSKRAGQWQTSRLQHRPLRLIEEYEDN
jgi:hypothetical protein